MSAIVYAAKDSVVAVPGGGGAPGAQGAKGDPGGNVSSIALLKDAHALAIPVGTDLVQTSGNESIGDAPRRYVADATIDSAALTAHPRSGFIDSGGRGFRVLEDAPLTPQALYQATDANFGFAVVRALAYLKSRALTGYGYGNVGAARLVIPKPFAAAAYDLGANTLDLDFGLIIEGDSIGLVGPAASVLKWDAGVTGIRLQEYNTTGATGVLGSPGTSSGRALIRNLLLTSTYSGTESEAHGVHARTLCTLENVTILDFAGDGVHINASASSGVPNEGNANSFYLRRVFAQNCRSGFYTDGADANAGKMDACFANSNRRWGFWESSFLGNTYDACQAADNGLVAGSVPSVVSYSGNRYCVVKDQGVGASTNAPSGTTADNAWWYYMGAGGTAPSVNINTWVSGTTYRDGGSYRGDGEGNANNLFSGCYQESGQGLAQIDAPALVSGGSMRPNVRGVACLYGGSGGLPDNLGFIGSSGGFRGDGNLDIFGPTINLGPTTGPARDFNINLNNTNFFTGLNFFQSGVQNGYVAAIAGATYINGTNGVHQRFNGSDVANAVASGEAFPADKGVTGSNTAAPTTGAHTAGETVFNSAPTAGGKVGWVCVTGGTPGTWKAFGAIDA